MKNLYFKVAILLFLPAMVSGQSTGIGFTPGVGQVEELDSIALQAVTDSTSRVRSEIPRIFRYDNRDNIMQADSLYAGDIIVVPQSAGGNLFYKVEGDSLSGYSGRGVIEMANGQYAHYTASFVDPLAFGIPMDGITEATSELTDAFAYTSISGIKEIRLPTGRFNMGGFGDFAVASDSIKIVGAGIGNTIIYNTSNGTEAVNFSEMKNIIVEGVTFAGRAGVNFNRIIDFSSCDYVWIDRCEFTVFDDNFVEGPLKGIDIAEQSAQMNFKGIDNLRVSNSLIKYSQIKVSGNGGGDSRGIWIDNNEFYETNDFAFSAVSRQNTDEQIENIFITNNLFDGNVEGGFLFFGADGSAADPADTTRKIITDNNVFKNHRSVGAKRLINMSSMSAYTTDIKFTNNSYDGIADSLGTHVYFFLGSCDTCVMENIQIENNSITNLISGEAFRITIPNGRGFYMGRNHIAGNRLGEIRFRGEFTHAIFSDNYLAGEMFLYANAPGTNTKNIVFDNNMWDFGQSFKNAIRLSISAGEFNCEFRNNRFISSAQSLRWLSSTADNMNILFTGNYFNKSSLSAAILNNPVSVNGNLVYTQNYFNDDITRQSFNQDVNFTEKVTVADFATQDDEIMPKRQIDSLLNHAIGLSVTNILDFQSIASGSSDLTISLPGVLVGDIVTLGIPSSSVTPSGIFTAWVSAPDVVTVRFTNPTATAEDPAPGTFKVSIIR